MQKSWRISTCALQTGTAGVETGNDGWVCLEETCGMSCKSRGAFPHAPYKLVLPVWKPATTVGLLFSYLTERMKKKINITTKTKH